MLSLPVASRVPSGLSSSWTSRASCLARSATSTGTCWTISLPIDFGPVTNGDFVGAAAGAPQELEHGMAPVHAIVRRHQTSLRVSPTEPGRATASKARASFPS